MTNDEPREIFERALIEWRAHLSHPEICFSSDAGKFLECEAYQRIKRMGASAFPLIREAYDRTGDSNFETIKMHGLVSLVMEIAGQDFKIPQEISGNMKKIRDYTKKWLDEYCSLLAHAEFDF